MTTTETIHATTIAIAGRAILITGPSGIGKSDLALRLIDRGARLVSDDYTRLRRAGDLILATAPDNIAGLLEVRGLGILRFPVINEARIALHVELAPEADRLPETGATVTFCEIPIATVRLRAHETALALKVELALENFGYGSVLGQ